MTKYSNIIQPDNSITDLTQQLKDATAAYNTLTDQIKKDSAQVAQALDSVAKSANADRKEILSLVQDVDKLTSQQNTLDAAYKKSVQSINEREQAHKKLAQAQSEESKKTSQSIGEMREGILSAVKASEQFIGTLSENSRLLASYRQEIAQNSKAIAEWEDYAKMGGKAAEKASVEIENLAASNATLKVAASDLNRTIDAQVKAMIAPGGSAEELAKNLELLRIAYRKMTDEEKLSPVGIQTVEAINEADLALKQFDTTIGNSQRFIGDYGIALRGLGQIIPGAQQGLTSLAAAFRLQNQLEKDGIKNIPILSSLTRAWGNANTWLATTFKISAASANLLMGALTLGLAPIIGFIVDGITKLYNSIGTGKANEAASEFDRFTQSLESNNYAIDLNSRMLKAQGASALTVITNERKLTREAQEQTVQRIDAIKNEIKALQAKWKWWFGGDRNLIKERQRELDELTQIEADYQKKIQKLNDDADVQMAQDRTDAAKKSENTADKRMKVEEKAYKDRVKIERSLNESTIALMEDGYNKEAALREEKQRAAIEDMEFDRDLRIKYNKISEQEVDSYNQAIKAKEAEYRAANLKAEQAHQAELLQARATGLQNELALLDERSPQYLAKMQEIWENQRQQELAANRLLANELRQDEDTINKKWDRYVLNEGNVLAEKVKTQSLDNLRALNNSEVDLTIRNEKKKEALKLQYEADYWRERLKMMRENTDKYSAEEISTVENQIKDIEKRASAAMAESKTESIWSMLGFDLNSKQQAVLNQAVNTAIGFINELAQARVDAADKAVQASQRDVDQAYQNLQIQLQLAEMGYANNVATAQAELEEKKRIEAEALIEQERAVKAQQQLEAVQQASSLVTATAGIWASFGKLGPWGIAAAVAATALMWGSFAAAKIKAKQMTTVADTYGDGGQGVIGGGTHASGNDTFIGTNKDGRQRRAERGERWAVFSTAVTRNGGKALERHLADIQRHGYSEDIIDNSRYSSDINIIAAGTDNSRLESDVSAIRRQGATQITSDGKYRVTRYKNLIKRERIS